MYDDDENAADLRMRLAQAEADRDVLAAEVMAWRLRDEEGTKGLRGVQAAAYLVESSGALDRAKEVK